MLRGRSTDDTVGKAMAISMNTDTSTDKERPRVLPCQRGRPRIVMVEQALASGSEARGLGFAHVSLPVCALMSTCLPA